MRRKFLQAEWSNLIMANYAIDPTILSPFLPKGVELDYFSGKSYVSLVGFMFLNTKVLGLPIPFYRNFEEVNLRFYVKRKNEHGEWRRGVVFISEIVPKKMISLVANVLYGERYSCLPMQNELEVLGNERQLSYYWKTGDDWNFMEVNAAKTPVSVLPNSKEEFILEHYWGYTKGTNTTTEYQVEHPQWKIYPVNDYDIHFDIQKTYGETFVDTLSKEPESVFLAVGSEVSVRFGKKLKMD